MAAFRSRRNFLAGRFTDPQPAPPVPRPPGAVTAFASLCDGCGACAAACPAQIVRAGSTGPELDMSRGACTFCGACARACPTGALDPAAAGASSWRAAISGACLSVGGVTCRSCEDACDPRAIRFRLMTAGRSVPVLDPDRCTGCGGCVSACPMGAASLVDARHPEDGARP